MGPGWKSLEKNLVKCVSIHTMSTIHIHSTAPLSDDLSNTERFI
eukprot:Gb_36261 [translate_table: standard]